MKVSTVLAALQQEDPNSEIMIQWYTKSDVEAHTRAEYTEAHWNLSVALFDKWDTGMDDYNVIHCVAEARERLMVL
ncbi:MAG: hypothetical protein EBY75_06080 [Actinobacteria bacterium]|jgi:hypothetical protein|nr:hypothetical protein [Actinomycetota bacterium]NDA96192.1 hypothetical protein [Actinomycetota bacterium]NDI00012.1 hypothetical protein [Actinomycetota bacterium]